MFNLLVYGSSSHLWSAHGNVGRYADIPNCLIVASTSHAYVLLTELIDETALSLARNIPIALF